MQQRQWQPQRQIYALFPPFMVALPALPAMTQVAVASVPAAHGSNPLSPAFLLLPPTLTSPRPSTTIPTLLYENESHV